MNRIHPNLLKPRSIKRPATSLFIHNESTLQKALKTYLKNLKTLHLHTFSRFLPKSSLRTLQRRTKSLTALNFEEYPNSPLSLIKSFRHIKSLTLPGDDLKYHFIKLYIKWLSRAKKLTDLTFGNIQKACSIGNVDFPNQNPYAFRWFEMKYLRALKRTKLRSLTLDVSQRVFTKYHHYYPSTLQKISVIPLDFTFIKPEFNSMMNLFHLPNLRILQLDLEISFQNLLYMLFSLRYPFKLYHLTAHISDDFGNIGQQIPNLPEFLTFTLRSLHLTFKKFSPVYNFLRSWKSPQNLRQLSLQIPMQNSDHLLEIALLIKNCHNLSCLAIKNEGFFQYSNLESHRKFLQHISEMIKLKSLDLNLLEVMGAESTYEDENGYFREYINCLEALRELEEIRFVQSRHDKKEDMHLLVDFLKKKGSRIKRLHLRFLNQEYKTASLKKFSKAFGRLENLEELCIEGLFFKRKSFERFSKAIQKLKWLKILTLGPVETNFGIIAWADIIREILVKKGLEEFKWRQRSFPYNAKEIKEPIDFGEVLLRNPQLRKFGHTFSTFLLECDVFRKTEALATFEYC